MTPSVVIYQLGSKFVSQQADVPEDARQVVYYSLAIGHHVGVMDCFSAIAEIPLEDYCAWLEQLPAGPGRTKMEGVVRWGEIEINHSHAGILLPVFAAALEAGQDSGDWTALLIQRLQAMQQEPALYLMVRKRL